MCTAGDLRDHAAIDLVHVDLRCNSLTDNDSSIAHKGGGGFIAGRFDAEDQCHAKTLGLNNLRLG